MKTCVGMNAEAHKLCYSGKAAASKEDPKQAGPGREDASVLALTCPRCPAPAGTRAPCGFSVSRQPWAFLWLSASWSGVFTAYDIAKWTRQKTLGKEILELEVNKNPFCHLTASPSPASFSRALGVSLYWQMPFAPLRRDNKNLQPCSVLFFSSPDRREPNGL